MAAASAAGRPHGMLSVIGLGDDVLEPLCAAAVARGLPDTVCQIANLLFPTGRVVSGHKDALAEVRGTSVVNRSGTASTGASAHHLTESSACGALSQHARTRVSQGHVSSPSWACAASRCYVDCAGMRQVQAAAIKAGAIKAALLPVSGAFHTRLMAPARAALIKAGARAHCPSVSRACVRCCSGHASTWHACTDLPLCQISLMSGMSLLGDLMLSTRGTV